MSNLTKTKNFIKDRLKERQSTLNGTIFRLGDGMANIFGLDAVKAGELLYFPSDQSYGIAFNLEQSGVGAILLSDGNNLKEGDRVESTGRFAEIDVKSSILGTVVDSIGTELLPSLVSEQTYFKKDEAIGTQAFEAGAPAILSRKPVNESLQTGILAIDALIPIGRGQRELLIGDRQIGKTQVGLDTILNLHQTYKKKVQLHQKGEIVEAPRPIVCVYVAVGQKGSQVAEIQSKLGEAMEHTIIVSATASSAASMQYLAPFTGTAIAEAFMNNEQIDTLIIYDDLSRHAQAYREMSLLLKRPPGREAYPGDVFYLHARLLERSARLAAGGSLTALPIIETLAGDISAYIPTNVISITDGQVFFSKSLFNQGQRPALDVGLSVSRVGSAAQPKTISKLAGNLKIVLAQFRELQVFTQFSSDIDAEAQAQLDAGTQLTSLFVQPPEKPYTEYLEYALLYAFQTVFKKMSVSEMKDAQSLVVNAFDQPIVDEYIKIYEKNESIDKIKESLDKLFKEINCAV